MKIDIVTSNKGKQVEIRAMLEPLGYEVEQLDIGYPEIQAERLEEVVSFGLEFLSRVADRPVIIDDSGLFIKSLGGFPGVYSAYVYKNLGCPGVLKLLKGEKDRRAEFQCVMGYCEPGREPVLFKGVCKGTLAHKMRGDKGFGYDPIFVPTGKRKTFAQMEMEEKNKLSHRGKALRKVKKFLKD